MVCVMKHHGLLLAGKLIHSVSGGGHWGGECLLVHSDHRDLDILYLEMEIGTENKSYLKNGLILGRLLTEANKIWILMNYFFEW